MLGAWGSSTLGIPELTRTEVAYIESMYRLNESHDATSVSVLAKRFGVRLPTAIEILDKLEQKGLVIRKPWRVPELSKRGKILAESVMHQHRVVELYFSRNLGLNSEMSCSEASKIAYLLDRTVIEKMCKSLNRPTQCIHGNPIRHRD
jgi:Mn-dependent DtxR family transcriptional regulator